MGLESATYLDSLVETNPVVGDPILEGDDHLRLLKAVLKTTFPSFTRPFRHDTLETASADLPLDATDDRGFKSIDATAAARSVTLPDSPTAGFEVTVAKSDSSGNAVTVNRAGTNTINGATNFAIATQYQSAKFKYIGGGLWFTPPAASGDVSAAANFGTDNVLIRSDGTLKGVQFTGISVADTTNNVSGTGSIIPASNDGGALGSASLSYSDLFLASGGVINWNNGDVTATHSANTLTFAGATSGYVFNNGIVTIQDANHYLGIVSSNPYWSLDSTDYLTYDRATNAFLFGIGGASELTLTATVLGPVTNDGLALGTATVSYADLFLASGAVVNWNNGDVTLTHGANQLTFAGASSGYLFDAVTAPSTNDGAPLGNTANMWSDLFLASGGVINWNNGDVTVTHSTNTLTITGGITVLDANSTVGGVLIKTVGIETIYVPGSAIISRTTNGGAAGTTEMGSNRNMFVTVDFDTTTQEFAQFSIRMPKSWNEGTVTARFTWSHAATATNFGVVWGIQGIAISDDDAGDVAFGTGVTVSDTGGTTNDIYITSATGAVTIGGSPAAEDWVIMQIYRDVSAGGDTLAVDARLHGVTLYFTTDAATDA